MAKRTARKSKSSGATTKVNPAQPQQVVEVQEVAEPAQKKEKRKRNKPQRLQNAQGTKAASGLQWPLVEGSTEEFSMQMVACIEGKAQRVITERAFAKPHFYYLYMAEKARFLAEQYAERAVLAEENPSAYGTAARRKARKEKAQAELQAAQAKAARVESTEFATALAAKLGVSVEEAQAFVAAQMAD